MSDMAALLQRIDRLESRHEIAELVSAYGIACDDHDIARLETMFTETASFATPSGLMTASGRDEIIDMFIRVLKTRGPSYHWSHDRFVSFDDTDPDRATGLVLSHAETSRDGVGSVAALRYEDEYRRVDGRWMFEKRTIHFLYYVPVTEYATVLDNSWRLAVGDERLEADFPETLPAWQKFFREHGDEG